MVVDTLENLEKYASLNPLFAQAIEFLKSHDLQAMEIGKTELKGKDLLVNIAQTKPKTKEEAKLETHNEFIDIQIPLSGTEVMGYTAAKDCVPADAPYNVFFLNLYGFSGAQTCALNILVCSSCTTRVAHAGMRSPCPPSQYTFNLYKSPC